MTQGTLVVVGDAELARGNGGLDAAERWARAEILAALAERRRVVVTDDDGPSTWAVSRLNGFDDEWTIYTRNGRRDRYTNGSCFVGAWTREAAPPAEDVAAWEAFIAARDAALVAALEEGSRVLILRAAWAEVNPWAGIAQLAEARGLRVDDKVYWPPKSHA